MTPDANTGRSVEIVVDDLHKSYNEVQVLRGLSLRVAPREIFAIMGQSGCGKSVFLRHIIGLETPDRGRVLVGGRDVSNPVARRELNLAMVFQSSALLNSLTVSENVALWLREHTHNGDDEIKKLIREKLDLLELNGAADKLPMELSGGMRKRVAIARALIMNPSLILYDEPTSELDPVRAANLAKIIRGLREKVDLTTMIVTHDREMALTVADRIAMMHEGVLIETGTAAQFRASNNPVVHEFLQAGHNSAITKPGKET